MLCVRLPACVRAQDPRGKGYGLGWAIPLRIESPFAPQPPKGRGTQHSCGDIFPFAWDGETAPSLCLKTSQLPCQYITCMHNNLSFSWIAKILTFPTILGKKTHSSLLVKWDSSYKTQILWYEIFDNLRMTQEKEIRYGLKIPLVVCFFCNCKIRCY